MSVECINMSLCKIVANLLIKIFICNHYILKYACKYGCRYFLRQRKDVQFSNGLHIFPYSMFLSDSACVGSLLLSKAVS